MSRRFLGNTILVAVSVGISLLGLELALRVLTPFPINTRSNKQRDAELVYVLDPALSDVNEAGFRNDDITEDSPVYAIGDSHTYGVHARSEKAWPKQLEAILGRDVYNLGVPSYNVYQYFRLFEIAASRKPTHVVVALYPANDLTEGVCEILDLAYWRDRIPELGLTNVSCSNAGNTDGPVRPISRLQRAKNLKYDVAFISALALLVWHPIQAYVRRLGDDMDPGAAARPDDPFVTFSGAHTKLRVLKAYVEAHIRSTDLSDPGVSEQLANSMTLFRRMKAEADENGVKLLVMIVPSKQRVLCEWARTAGVEAPPLLARAYELETLLAQEFGEFLASLGVPTADATGRMATLVEADLQRGVDTYPDSDGHPFEAGYRVYAEVAASLFAEPQVGK